MNFPVLKTAAVAQYPLERSVEFATQSVRFLDGSQQRFRLYGTGRRRWAIKLDLLDEQELDAVIAFGEAQGSAVFAFADPISGTTVDKCIISRDRFDATMTGESVGQAVVEIEEIA
jgi:hypothetical protein